MRTVIYRALVALCCLMLSQQVVSFDVTSGQSGAWYDPSHDGEGYFLQVLNENLAVVYWFTYDKDGNQYWMTGVGNISGSKITFDTMQSASGGKFGPGFDPEDVVYSIWGTLDFDFGSCDAATATYSGPAEFGSGVLNLTRITQLWGLDCQGNDAGVQSTGKGFLSGGFSGSWYDPSHNGEGFVVEVLNETTAIVIWFTYDTEGQPVWLLGSAQIDGASLIISDFNIASGGVFGPGFNPDDVEFKPWGPAAYTFGSCGVSSSGGAMRYVPPENFGGESTQLLNRLVSIHGLACGFLSDTYDIQATMKVAENIFLDGDVNNPAVPEVSNDLDATSAQQLASPARVAGFVTAEPTASEGDRFAEEKDEWDVYVLPVKSGESISLNISDWNSANPQAVDLDLYLANVNDPATTVDSSNSTNQTEWVTAPEDGTYFVLVQAYAGTSNYLLRSGQSAPNAEVRISAAQNMTAGELIAAIRPQNGIESSNGKKSYQPGIEKIEKHNSLTRVAESGNGNVLYRVDNSRMHLLEPHPLTRIGRGSITAEAWQVTRAAKVLSSNDEYRWAGPNYINEAMAIPNDEFYKYQWHYRIINLPEAWNITTGSSSVVVAVIDTGVSRHADLVGNVDYTLGYDFVQSTLESGDGDGLDADANDPGKSFPAQQDYRSHGTHVAGTVGASGNNGTGITGVNWNVTIMPLRVLGVDGTGSCWQINEAVKWAAQLSNASGLLPAKKADIINMSLGLTSPCPGGQEIIDAATAKGVVVIAASGNANNAVSSYPASFNNVISVAATDLVDERAPYSSYGQYVDVAAPGGDSTVDKNSDTLPDGILSTVQVVKKGTDERSMVIDFMQGTSMASPHIAGIAALMKSVYPGMGYQEFFSAISSGTVTVDLAKNGATVKDIQFGYGRIDVQRAVNWAREQDQGQPAMAYLTSSISSANFGSSQQSIDFEIAKGGSGSLSVTGGGDTADWMGVYILNTDSDGLGTYQIQVDRKGLLNGSYSGGIVINGSDGSQIAISVVMQVGESVAGEAGQLYALLTDSWTLGNLKQWGGLAGDNSYDINLSDNPPGTYYLIIGSDNDNDSTICDEGEFCQFYPLSEDIGEIVISGEDIQLGDFVMGFPDNSGDADVSAKGFGPEPADTQDDVLDVRRLIEEGSGVSRRR